MLLPTMILEAAFVFNWLPAARTASHRGCWTTSAKVTARFPESIMQQASPLLAPASFSRFFRRFMADFCPAGSTNSLLCCCCACCCCFISLPSSLDDGPCQHCASLVKHRLAGFVALRASERTISTTHGLLVQEKGRNLFRKTRSDAWCVLGQEDLQSSSTSMNYNLDDSYCICITRSHVTALCNASACMAKEGLSEHSKILWPSERLAYHHATHSSSYIVVVLQTASSATCRPMDHARNCTV